MIQRSSALPMRNFNGYKNNSSFRRSSSITCMYAVVGFMLGFLAALTTLFFHSQNVQFHAQHQQPSSSSSLLSKWQSTSSRNDDELHSSQRFALVDVNDDDAVTTTAQLSLDTEVRILCMVLTCPNYHESRARHILNTWGKRCNKLIFASSETDTTLGAYAVVDNETDLYANLWIKTRAGFRHVYDKYYDDFDWFFKSDDDTYVIMENLRYMLYAYDPLMPIYFGHKLVLRPSKLEYMSGGASYVLSKEALRRVVVTSYENGTCCPKPYSYAEDVCLGYCMHKSGVHLADTRMAIRDDDKPKFFPLDLAAFLVPELNVTMPEWLIRMTPYDLVPSFDCCSNNSIVFHYEDAGSMYRYEFLIYYLNAFGLSKPTMKLPMKLTHQDIDDMFPLATDM